MLQEVVYMSDFSYRLRDLRRENDLTGERLAILLGDSKNNISRWENGKHIPDSEKLKKIAQVFNVSTDYLLGISNYKQKIEPLQLDAGTQKLYSILVDVGIVKQGEDLTDEQLNKLIRFFRIAKALNEEE